MKNKLENNQKSSKQNCERSNEKNSQRNSKRSSLKVTLKPSRTVLAVLLALCLALENNLTAACAGQTVPSAVSSWETAAETKETAEAGTTEAAGGAESTQSGAAAATAAQEEAYIVSEIKEKRDEYTKYFMMSDKTIMAASYKEKIHVLKDGKYEEINAELEESTEDGDEVLGNELGSIAVKYAKKAGNNKLVTIGKGNSKIKISLEGASKAEAEKLEAAQAPEGLDSRLIVNTGSEVIYRDILKNTDIAYTGSAETLKENIILKTKDVPESCTFTYKGSGKLGYRENDYKVILKYVQ